MTGQRRGHAPKGLGKRPKEHHSSRLPDVECSTHKVAIRSLNQLEGVASGFQRELNTKGLYADDLYGYRCPSCHHLHLTRMAEFQGRPNILAAKAAPRALQEWAMPKQTTAPTSLE